MTPVIFAVAAFAPVLTSPSTRAAAATCHGIDILRADAMSELPATPDALFSCVDLPWLDPDDPCVSSSLARLLFYQAPDLPLFTLHRSGPSLTVVAPKTITAEDCLLVGGGDEALEDHWSFSLLEPATVTITIEVQYPNAQCNLVGGGCAPLPSPAAGPLDPKLALYPPGVVPSDPFNGHVAPACADGLTGETGCAGKPADACIVCDNRACLAPGATPLSCTQLTVALPTVGRWTVAVAAQADGSEPQAQGCYRISVTSPTGSRLGVIAQDADDVLRTF